MLIISRLSQHVSRVTICGNTQSCFPDDGHSDVWNMLRLTIDNKHQIVLQTPQWTHYLLTGSDSLPAATAQYQHVAITLRSRQLLKMGTWLPETCRATCKGENKGLHKVTSSWFLSTLTIRLFAAWWFLSLPCFLDHKSLKFSKFSLRSFPQTRL